jgi:acetyltransferase-like isoleucine patch superfamily enzyme
MAYLTELQLKNLGFKSIGTNVLISDKSSIYNCDKISIGSNVRIDDFCIISAGSGGIYIGDYVHIACYVSIIGQETITIGNYCGISARTSIYSSSDDYSGEYLFGPTIDEKYKKVTNKSVNISNLSIIGANSMIMPGVNIGEGVATGAYTFVNKSLESWSVYIGIPAKKTKDRNKNIIKLKENHINNSK